MIWLLLGVFGCSGEAPAEVPEVFGAERLTQGLKYQVSLVLDPNPPVISELFTARVVLKDSVGEPIEDATVSLNATMPHHGHGMMTAPRDEPGVCDDQGVCTHPGGIYETTGFKFHMGGPWTVSIDVIGPNGRDDLSFIYEMQ